MYIKFWYCKKICNDQKYFTLQLSLFYFVDEDPPEYDVTEKLKIYNEELAKDPTPIEKRKDSRVGFKDTLVDLVVPPSDDDETPRPSEKSKSDSANKNNNNEKIVIEQGGKFEVVNSDDVRAKEHGLPQYIDESLNEDKENRSSSSSSSSHKPAPPSNPRPSTANNSSSRRVVRPGSSKPRAQSARTTHDRPLENFSYNSPYAMSPEDKKLLRQQQEEKERQKQEEKRRKEEDEYVKERENDDIFQSWWAKKREQMKEQRKHDEEERKKNSKHDRVCLFILL